MFFEERSCLDSCIEYNMDTLVQDELALLFSVKRPTISLICLFK